MSQLDGDGRWALALHGAPRGRHSPAAAPRREGPCQTGARHRASTLAGGAGVINSDNAEWLASTRAGLEAALDVGAGVRRHSARAAAARPVHQRCGQPAGRSALQTPASAAVRTPKQPCASPWPARLHGTDQHCARSPVHPRAGLDLSPALRPVQAPLAAPPPPLPRSPRRPTAGAPARAPAPPGPEAGRQRARRGHRHSGGAGGRPLLQRGCGALGLLSREGRQPTKPTRLHMGHTAAPPAMLPCTHCLPCRPPALCPPAAGRGSVLTVDGRHELEASVMTGERRCGAASLLTRGALLGPAPTSAHPPLQTTLAPPASTQRALAAQPAGAAVSAALRASCEAAALAHDLRTAPLAPPSPRPPRHSPQPPTSPPGRRPSRSVQPCPARARSDGPHAPLLPSGPARRGARRVPGPGARARQRVVHDAAAARAVGGVAGEGRAGKVRGAAWGSGGGARRGLGGCCVCCMVRDRQASSKQPPSSRPVSTTK